LLFFSGMISRLYTDDTQGRRHMAITSQKIEPHWNYLLAIENDLTELSRYVDFDERNFGCFSIQIARVLLSASAEIDVVCKQICRNIDSQSNANSIHKYRDKIVSAYPAVPQFQVVMPFFGLTLTPWDEWKNLQGIPFWWSAYNKIKHNRDTEYHQASLKNALNAVAGLFIMVLYLYKDKAEQGDLHPSLQLLRVDNSHYGGISVGGYGVAISYKL